MKIAIDVSQMCYSGTGVARYVHALTRTLLETHSLHEFVFFAGALRQRSFFTNLAQTVPWNRAQWHILPMPPKVARLVLGTLPITFESFTGPVDLIHASDWIEPSTSLPMVTTVHDLVFKRYPETVDPLILKAQVKRLDRLTKNTTHIIADSMSTKNDLMEIYGMTSERITVVYPGLDAGYKPQKKQEIDRVKKKYNLPDQFIFSLGTQEPRKNLARLTEASRGIDIPLVLAGKHGWGATTQTLGYVSDEDLPGLYSAATVFAYPSLYEGFGFPVIEAMACGTPVVTANVSSLPEVAGKAAILVDPLDVSAIRSGIKQAVASRNTLIQLGRKQAKQFTWTATAKQVLEVYEQIAHRD